MCLVVIKQKDAATPNEARCVNADALFNRLIRQELKFRLPGKMPGLVTCDVTTEGRTVQAVACRAAECGFDSHPRLQIALFGSFWMIHAKKRRKNT